MRTVASCVTGACTLFVFLVTVPFPCASEVESHALVGPDPKALSTSDPDVITVRTAVLCACAFDYDHRCL